MISARDANHLLGLARQIKPRLFHLDPESQRLFGALIQDIEHLLVESDQDAVGVDGRRPMDPLDRQDFDETNPVDCDADTWSEIYGKMESDEFEFMLDHDHSMDH